MTSRGLYEAVQIEINKENAPNLLLEDFNHYANKVLYQYINKRYNIYDINQQTTDDLRVLKATTKLVPQKVDDYNSLSTTGNTATYYVDLPSDYLHLLNCICVYNVKKTYKCYNAGDTWRAAATRLTADMYSQVLDNFWNKPTYYNPYYYIHNANTSDTVPTNPINGHKGTDVTISSVDTADGNVAKVGNAVPRTIKLNGSNEEATVVERTEGLRYGNTSPVRLEIRYGTDNRVFELQKVYIDYLKVPQYFHLQVFFYFQFQKYLFLLQMEFRHYFHLHMDQLGLQH